MGIGPLDAESPASLGITVQSFATNDDLIPDLDLLTAESGAGRAMCFYGATRFPMNCPLARVFA